MNQSMSSPSPGESVVPNGRIRAALKSHQRKIRVLTAVAFLFGFFSIAGSVAVVSCYFVAYLPKQMQLLRDVTVAAREAGVNSARAEAQAGTRGAAKFDFPSVQATMTYALSIGVTFLAAALGMLALGTLVLLAVVVLQRRTTLTQINTSLAQISEQF